MNEKEIFREIDGFPDYEVSNLGRVCSFKGKYPRILKPGKDSCGYPIVGICNGGKQVTKRVHRLVAKAFVPNPENKPEVNHIDENKGNNVADNLEWVTCRENINHGTGIRRSIEARSKAVIQYTTKGVFIGEYPSIKEAERVTGISKSHICKVCRGKRKTAGGYLWLYDGEEESC